MEYRAWLVFIIISINKNHLGLLLGPLGTKPLTLSLLTSVFLGFIQATYTFTKPRVFCNRTCNLPLQTDRRAAGSDKMIQSFHTGTVRFH